MELWIYVDAKAKCLLCGLLCCDKGKEAKQFTSHEDFLIAEADITLLPDKDEEFAKNAPADFA